MRIAIFFNFALHFEGTLTNKKMKKVLKAFIMLVCAGSMLAAVSSCEGNEDTQEVISYYADGNVSTVSSSDGNYYDRGLTDYNDAIKELLGGVNYVIGSNRDSDVIAACNAVYERHLGENLNLKGTVKIHKATGSQSDSSSDSEESLPSTVIAKYTYGE